VDEVTRQRAETDGVIFYLGGNPARLTEVVGLMANAASAANVELSIMICFNNVNKNILLTK
jgi:hypothetical protein